MNAESGLVLVPIRANANATELTKDFEVPSQIGSKRDTHIRILHTTYLESYLNAVSECKCDKNWKSM